MPQAGDSPFLRMEINPDGAGGATGELVIDAVHRNPYGIVHGGVYAALADNAMGGAITGLMGIGKTFTTVYITGDGNTNVSREILSFGLLHKGFIHIE